MTFYKNTYFKPAMVCLTLLLLWTVLPLLLNVKMVYLWTDKLIFILICSLVFFITYVRHKEHLRQPWREVFHRKLAMVSLVILVVYVTIGLLDSVHFRKPLGTVDAAGNINYAVDVNSLFDEVVSHLHERTERTYSAPFATHALSKESMEVDGQTVRDYPRLKYGGAHLENIDDKLADIFKTSMLGIIVGLGTWLAIVYSILQILALRKGTTTRMLVTEIRAEHTLIPWKTIIVSTAVVVVTIMVLLFLSFDYHVFGTDKVGKDVLYLALKSIRTGLVIGTLTTLVMLPFAVGLGIMAGYFKGKVDDVIQYIYTTLSSIPGVLLIAAAILSIQLYIDRNANLIENLSDRSDLRLLALCVILGITSWTSLCRLLRGETLKIREVDYIQAATAFGVSHFKIMLRHILPNVMHIVLIVVVLDFSGLVLAEAVLSYIGIGVDQSTVSWGNMINSARMELAREPLVWWSLVAAFLFMSTLVLAANLFSDAVRDAFDPRLKQITKS